jgi:hypothetical protein
MNSLAIIATRALGNGDHRRSICQRLHGGLQRRRRDRTSVLIPRYEAKLMDGVRPSAQALSGFFRLVRFRMPSAALRDLICLGKRATALDFSVHIRHVVALQVREMPLVPTPPFCRRGRCSFSCPGAVRLMAVTV